MDTIAELVAADSDRTLLDGLGAPSTAAGPLEAEAWRIGVEVSAPAAADVDAFARFPSESLAALRESGLLAALVPTELGGRGAALDEVVGAVRALAVHCSASALVLAMHSIEIVNLVRHGATPGLRAILREVAENGLLLANANSEVGLGGDVSRSLCAFEANGDRLHLEKDALAISYGAHADAIVTIARATPEAAPGDQVMAVVRKGDYTLEKSNEWSTMGLRGTCSNGFHVSADVDPELVFPVPFAVISNDGAAQARHLLLSAVWVGLAEAAAGKAHAFAAAGARKNIGVLQPAAVRVAELALELHALRSQLIASALRYAALDRTGNGEDAGLLVALRGLKVTTSRAAARIATEALEICGMVGFRTDTPFALDRIVRDAHGGLVMVSNERGIQDNAQLLTVRHAI